MAQPRIGIQLIIYGKRWQEDLAGVLREVAGAGYDGIECGDLAAYYPVEQISQLLAETGLQLVGVHAGFNNVADPSKLNASLDLVTALGGSYLVCSGVGQIQGIENLRPGSRRLQHGRRGMPRAWGDLLLPQPRLGV